MKLPVCLSLALIALILPFVVTSFATPLWRELFTFVDPYFAAEAKGYEVLSTPAKPLSVGTCDTAGPIEVESTSGNTVPTAYLTLKLAFDAVNAGTHKGNINIEVCGDTDEGSSFPVLNSGAIAPASYSAVTIRPVGANRVIEGTPSATAAIIKLYGADNVTIDGRQGGTGTQRDLTIRNNGTFGGSAAIWLASAGIGNGATNNVVRNLELAGGWTQNTSGATTFGIIMSGSALSVTSGGDDNDNNSFVANRITRVRYGIVTRGQTANNNQIVTVSDNIIGPSAFGPDEIGKAGILMQADTGAVVSGNHVQFVGGGVGNTPSGADRCGICIGTESWSATDTTSITSGGYTVTGNTIHDIVEERTSSAVGIRVGTTRSGAPTGNLIANNIIFNVRSNGTGGEQPVGIGWSAGHTDTIAFNSISMVGDMDPGTAAAATTYGNAIRVTGNNGTNNANLSLKNNSIYLDASSSSTAANRYYAITLPSTSYSFGSGGIGNNNYYRNPGNGQTQTGGLGIGTSNSATTSYATLTDWTSAFAVDAGSIQADPLYVSNTSDLHITSLSPNESAGVAVTGVTDDIDGDVRAATPDIGADEVAAAEAATLEFSSAAYAGGEGDGTVTLTVTRTGSTNGALSVDYTLAGGTATGGAACGGSVDYVDTGGTVSFADGEASKTFSVAVCDDSVYENPDETFDATLSNATGGATIGSPNPATVTITNNDPLPAPVIGVSPASVPFGNVLVGSTSAPQNVTISNTGTADLSVTGLNITGANPGDFSTNASLPQTIAPGGTYQFSVSFTPPVRGARSASITFTHNAAQSPTVSLSGTGTAPSASVNPTSIPFGNQAVGTTSAALAFTISNNGDASQNLLIASIAKTGANAGEFSVTDDPSSTSIPAGGSVTVHVTFSPTSAGAKTALLTVNTNDPANPSPTVSLSGTGVQPGSFQLSSATYSASEGAGNVVISVTRTGGTDGAVSVSYGSVVGGTANAGGACTANVDYIALGGTLNWANGDGATKTFNVTVCDDSLYESPDETVNLGLSAPTGGTTLGTPNTAVLTINENDTAPSVQFSSATYVSSDDIVQNVVKADQLVPQVTTISIARSGAVDNAFSLNYATVAGGTATGGAACGTGSGVDYANASGTLSFAAGETLKTFNVTVCTDNRFEGNETVNLALSAPSAPVVLGTPNTAVLTITDNDTQPSLQFSSATYSFGEGVGNATITVTRTGAVDNTVSVDYSTVAGGTATGGASCGASVDYSNASGTVTFNAGVISQTFSVTICDDATTEASETINLALTSPVGGAVLGAQSTAVVTINDNDADSTPPAISYTPISSDPAATSLTASVTDAVGVTDATIFWNINGGSFTSAPCSLSGGTAQNGTWSCVISGASNPSAVAYYVTANDAAANTGTNPSGGASAPNLFTIGSATVSAGTYTNANLGNGVSLGGIVFVNGILKLSGVVNAGADTLSLGCSASITGGGEFSYVVGDLEKQFCGAGAFTFHVGAPFAVPPIAPESIELSPEGVASNYSPLTVNILGGTVGSSLTVNAVDAFMPGAVQTNSISRFWNVAENGSLVADMVFSYRNEDVAGDENSYSVLRRSGSFVAVHTGGTVNAAANTFTAPNVSNFSSWTAGTAVPTAAHSSLSGRVVDAGGYALSNVTVTIEGGGLTAPVSTRTNSFGNYSFDDLPAGYVYFVTVSSRRYVFGDPMQVVSVTDNVGDVDFTASATP